MEVDKKIISEIESELFSLITSATNLFKKYEGGIINDNFFRKAVRNAMKGLLKINVSLKEKNLSLVNILKQMNLVEEYNNAVRLIDKVSKISPNDENSGLFTKSHSKFAHAMKATVLELPGITSEITTSFITLMDALKLDGLKSSELIIKLFNDLKWQLNKFPWGDEILAKIEKINEQVLENINFLIENKFYREKIVDQLYNSFNEFQNNINLKIE